MPIFTIDGKKIEAEEGKTIIEAAYANGMDIPHFCWHPELSVAGNCRMCLVEVGMPRRTPDGTFEVDDNGELKINYIPKLQIACATRVSDGMVVNTNNEKVIDAQEAVMEFLLINHPLDCPICDEAGECKLQEYAYTHSKGESRFDETKNHKDKRVAWGPNVMFDGERCISCSRCIRYAKEVAKQDVLTFVQRGDHVTIKTFEGTQWDNPYSMNVIEICPVGALTSPDFRFKARVWDMSFNDSISFADSTGSNISIGVRNNEILRIEPKTNMYVNRYWLSDDARLNHYKFVNENRLRDPEVKIKGVHQVVSWQEAYEAAANKLKEYDPSEIMIIASPKATNESNFILKQFADKYGIKNIDFLKHIDESFEDGFFLGVKDRAPNTAGAKALGLEADDISLKALDLIENVENGKIKAIIVLEETFEKHPNLIEAIKNAECSIVMQYNNNVLTRIADVVLPASTYAEIEGTYTNKDNRVQHFEPALVTKENLRFMGMKMSRLDRMGAYNDRWTSHELRNCRPSWKIIQGIAKYLGIEFDYKRTEEVFSGITSSNESFKNMTYELLDEYQGIVLGKADNPDPKLVNYESHSYKPQTH